MSQQLDKKKTKTPLKSNGQVNSDSTSNHYIDYNAFWISCQHLNINEKFKELASVLSIREKKKETTYLPPMFSNTIQQLIAATSDSKPELLPTTQEGLYYKLSVIGAYKRELTKEINEKTGRVKYIKLNQDAMAELLVKHCCFALIGKTADEDASLYVYHLDQGIYVKWSLVLGRLVNFMQPGLSKLARNDVLEDIKLRVDTYEPYRNPNQMIVGNGIFDVPTQTLLPFSPDYKLTTKISTNYVSNAPKPFFPDWDPVQFVNEQFNGDKDDQSMFLELFQFAALTTRPKNAYFNLYDPIGNTGKSMTIDWICHFVGANNAGRATMDQINSQYGLSVIYDKAVIASSENDATFIKNNSNLKNLATGDELGIEEKFKSSKTVLATPLVLLASNKLPRYADLDGGVKRRIRILEFRHSYTGRVNDRIKNEYIRSKTLNEWMLFTVSKFPLKATFTDSKTSLYHKNESEIESNPIHDYYTNRFLDFKGDLIKLSVLYADAKSYFASTGRPFGHSERRFKSDMLSEIMKDGRQWELIRTRSKMIEADYDWFYVEQRRLALTNLSSPLIWKNFTHPETSQALSRQEFSFKRL